MALGLFWASVCFAVFLAVVLLDRMGLFTNKNHFPVKGRTVVITGGSQGMGRGLAKLLAQKGANIVIVARNVKKLEDAVEYIKSVAASPESQRFHYISADLTSPTENTRVIEEVTAWNNGDAPDIVWANAGLSLPGLFVDTPVETIHSQMETNYFAAAWLAHAALKVWLKPASSEAQKQAQGLGSAGKSSDPPPRHIVFTSSTLAYCGIAGYTPYSPAKSALRSLSDTLRQELKLYEGARKSSNPSIASTAPVTDIKIHIVTPGTILSPGHTNEQVGKHAVTKILEEGDPAQDEDDVAKVAVQELEKGGYLISTQFLGQAMRGAMMGNSPRNGTLGIRDLLLSWAVSIVWLFVGPDLDGKVVKYGKEKGLASP